MSNLITTNPTAHSDHHTTHSLWWTLVRAAVPVPSRSLVPSAGMIGLLQRVVVVDENVLKVVVGRHLVVRAVRRGLGTAAGTVAPRAG